ncbi:MAG: hypothetical protein U9O06_02080 [Euryarchaeota archaeon]|nr:hypothetical protein [Euryarchaeota archaeon]
MDSHTRRRVLAVAAAAVGGVAGCLGSESSSSESHSRTDGPGRTIPDEQTTTAPPTLFRRTDSAQPPIRLPETDSSEDETPSPIREHYPRTTLVDSASMADRLVDDAGGDSSDDTDLASFVSATDFDAESLYLETRQVDQCFRLSLCYLSWQDNEIRTDYGRVLRPYDEQCTAEATAFESRLFRLPVALDADEISGYGSSTSSSRCYPAERRSNSSRMNQSTEPVLRMNSSSSSLDGSGLL